MDNNDLFYQRCPQTGRIRLSPDYMEDVRWMFDQLGVPLVIAINSSDFSALFAQARTLHGGAALERRVSQMRNPHSRHAFKALLTGDVERAKSLFSRSKAAYALRLAK